MLLMQNGKEEKMKLLLERSLRKTLKKLKTKIMFMASMVSALKLTEKRQRNLSREEKRRKKAQLMARLPDLATIGNHSLAKTTCQQNFAMIKLLWNAKTLTWLDVKLTWCNKMWICPTEKRRDYKTWMTKKKGINTIFSIKTFWKLKKKKPRLKGSNRFN